MSDRADIWRAVHAERHKLVADLAGLSLVEAYVHGEDIRRPLGIASDYPPAHVATALSYMCATTTAFVGGKERVKGLRLVPTDVEAVIGEGQEVQGTAIALLLAASGRPVGPTELRGPGALVPSGRG